MYRMIAFIKKLLGLNKKMDSKKINLILFGPPGSGKGTQAEHIINKYGLEHISTGDLFRYEMGNDTALGLEAKSYISKGELVPDSVTTGMLINKLNMIENHSGVIFDGYPRNINQCESLDKILADKDESVTHLIALDVEEEELVTRILGRGKTSGRADDNDESIIRNRIEVYRSETEPVFDYYNKKGVAKKINGIGSIEEIFSRISEQLS